MQFLVCSDWLLSGLKKQVKFYSATLQATLKIRNSLTKLTNCWFEDKQTHLCRRSKKELFSVETVDLMDRTGELVNLAERAQSTDLVSSLLKERESYIPLRVSSEFPLIPLQVHQIPKQLWEKSVKTLYVLLCRRWKQWRSQVFCSVWLWHKLPWASRQCFYFIHLI